MQIKRVLAENCEVPAHREMYDAIRRFSVLNLVFARIETDEGTSGTGFTYSIIRHGAREIGSIISRSIDSLIRGLDPLDHERIWYQMWRGLDWVGRGGIVVLAVAAVDIALWDLKAKIAGQPLNKLLGGARDRVPVYNTDGGWLNHTLEQLVDETRKIVAAGFRGTKIKVGKDDPMEDTERIAAVREVLGPKRTLMVDANERFTHAEAIKRARMWEEFNLFWFEEPLPAEDILGHARVKAHTSTPIALGESLFTRQQFKDYIASDGVSIVQPDCCRCGGITEWLKVAHMADCYNMQVSPHFVMELHLPLVAAVPNGLFVEYIPSLDGVLEKPLHLEDGYFRPSHEPGLGIKWSMDKLDRYRVKP
ncbi:MAG TPA: mandelate racemase/muconate lactonizing enzyme family protein [Terriglobia bacterium]|nr:mandelate racemase/muconate lactonizing enzyme family protein [Terriglobia bacterium]